MFDIRSGHPLISRFLFLLFSLASAFVFFFLFRSLVVYPQCYFCSGWLLFLMFTSYLQPLLGFQFSRDSKLPCPITGVWDCHPLSRLFPAFVLTTSFCLSGVGFFYSYSFPSDPVSSFGYFGFGFECSVT